MQYLRITASEGYENSWLPSSKASPASFRQSDWALHGFDFSRKMPKKMIICKPPSVSSFGADLPGSGKARGLHYAAFESSDNAHHYIFAATTQGLYYRGYNDTSWTSIAGSNYSYDGTRVHWETLVDPSGLFKVFYTFGDKLYKWSDSYGNATQEYPVTITRSCDKGNPQTISGGINLTWVNTRTVQSNLDASGTLKVGMWIRKNSSSLYWDEIDYVSSDGLTIYLTADTSESGAAGANTAQYSPVTTFDATQLLYWKGKLWTLSGVNLKWTVTDDVEDFTSTGAGTLSVGYVNTGGSQLGVGLASLGEYIFIFREYSYLVYRWTGDVDEPIELTRSWDYGCVSQDTIQNVGDAIVYCAGTAVRITTGGQDQILSEPIDAAIYDKNKANHTLYNTGTDGDECPQSGFDPVDELYILSFPTASTGREYWYSLKSKKWIGTTQHNMGAIANSKHLDTTNTRMFPLLFLSGASSNVLSSISRTGTLDYSHSLVLMSNLANFGASDKKKKVYWMEFSFVPLPGCNTNLGFDWWNHNETRDVPGTTFATNARAQSHNLILDDAYSGSPYYSYKRRFLLDGAETFGFSWVLFEDNTTPPSGDGMTAGWGIADITIAYDVMDSP